MKGNDLKWGIKSRNGKYSRSDISEIELMKLLN